MAADGLVPVVQWSLVEGESGWTLVDTPPTARRTRQW